MALFGYFPRTYIVNLPQRVDRRRQMDAMLRRVGLADDTSLEYFAAIRPDSPGGFPNLGCRGCFLSHLELLKRAQALQFERVLVLEDDLEIDPGFARNPASVIAALNQRAWGLAYFGHILEQDPEPDADGPWRTYTGDIVTTHFYAVNGPALPRLIDYLETVLTRPPGHPLGGPMNLDGAYNMFRAQNPDLETVVAWPNLGWQRSSKSDIGTKWFDRIPGVSALVEWARALRGR